MKPPHSPTPRVVQDPSDIKDINAPFGDDACTLKDESREPLANAILALFEKSDSSYVVSLDAPWGSGKTWFLHRFIHFAEQVSESKIKATYFSAWEHDFGEEPFGPLFSEIYSNLPESKFGPSLKEEAGTIFRHLCLNTAKIGTMGIVDLAAADQEIKESELAEKLVRQHKKYLTSITKFREALSSAVSSELSNLVIIIDELDRCRPDFAVEILERIKHLFGVKGVHFLLGMSWEPMAGAIEGRYGHGINGRDYLNRFVNISVTLPTIGGAQFARNYIDTQGISLNLSYGISDFFKEFVGLPREIQRITDITCFVKEMVGHQISGPYNEILIALAYVYFKNPEIVARTISSHESMLKLIRFLFEQRIDGEKSAASMPHFIDLCTSMLLYSGCLDYSDEVLIKELPFFNENNLQSIKLSASKRMRSNSKILGSIFRVLRLVRL